MNNQYDYAICNEEQSTFTINKNQTMSVDEECYDDWEESIIIDCWDLKHYHIIYIYI